MPMLRNYVAPGAASTTRLKRKREGQAYFHNSGEMATTNKAHRAMFRCGPLTGPNPDRLVLGVPRSSLSSKLASASCHKRVRDSEESGSHKFAEDVEREMLTL